MLLNVLKIPKNGVINQNTIGREREFHEFNGKVSQLMVFKTDKSDRDLLIIEDVLKD